MFTSTINVNPIASFIKCIYFFFVLIVLFYMVLHYDIIMVQSILCSLENSRCVTSVQEVTVTMQVSPEHCTVYWCHLSTAQSAGVT